MPANHTPDSPALAPVQMEADSLEMCGTCKFWNRDAQHKGQQGNIAACRRYPPTAQLVPQQLPGMRQAQLSPCAIPTITNAAEWCGEYKANPVL
jgi:hypothetical protein